jgi:hypothetical protein
MLQAWVMGAADPTSGTVSMHEVIRGFAYLLNNGWKPLRTIVFASWDAEEVGSSPSMISPLTHFTVVWCYREYRIWRRLR